MFDGFHLERIDTGEATRRVRVGGAGPRCAPARWSSPDPCDVAPELAREFTVVAPDLRGYGESPKPPTTDGHEPYPKGAMARGMVALMWGVGHERFAVAGHDRRGRCAYRLVLDHPERVERLAVLDIIPTWQMWRRADMRFGMVNYHWYFVSGTGIDCGHYIAEEAPGETYHHLRDFFASS